MADIDAAFKVIQNGEKSIAPVFMDAFLKGNPDAVHALNGNDRTLLMEASLNGRTPLLEVLLRHNAPVDARNSEGTTALMWAAIRGHDENVKVLVAAGADIRAKDDEGMSVVEYAEAMGRKKTIKLLQELLAAPAQPLSGPAPSAPPKP